MSQFTYQPADVPVKQENGLAVAGFVCSVLGLFTVILSPIGLVLSLVALGRPGGRGFAIAGVIVGLFGSCGILLALILIPAVILAALGLGIAFIALAEPEKMELTSDMGHIFLAAVMYKEEHDVLPADLSELNLRMALRTDPWGNPYEYHFIDEDPGFDIISRGEDGEIGTDDDIYLTKLGETWEASGIVVTEGDDDGGTVTFTLGDMVFTLHGDEQGGRITLDNGERIIELTRNEDGGDITVTVSPKEDDGDEEESAGESDGPASESSSEASSGTPD